MNTPIMSIIIWQFFILAALVLIIYSVIHLVLTKARRSNQDNLFWLILVAFVPLVGAVLYLWNGRKASSQV